MEPAARAWPVMGTMLEVRVWTEDPVRARSALDAARAAVARVDSLMSTYRAESELSAVNRRAGTDSLTPVSAETASVLAEALAYARASGGAFDPTVGPLVDAWGFHGSDGARPAEHVLDSTRALVGWERVELDPPTPSVRLPVAGMRLDFGALAKGYALDRAVAAVREVGVGRATVDLGGNLRFLGPSDDPEGRGVAIRDPREPSVPLVAISLSGGAVATSGDYERFFVADGVRYSHILDPRTGMPARGVTSVSVLAPSGLASDALSTALFVLGPSRGCSLARASEAEALWVLDDAGEERRLVATPGLRDRITVLDSSTVEVPRPCS